MSAPMDQPAGQAAPVKSSGPIDHTDMQDWMDRFNGVLSKSGEHINEKSPEDSREWNNSFFGCLDPIDLCTCCLPLLNASRLTFQA
jgi:hypothetical protein